MKKYWRVVLVLSDEGSSEVEGEVRGDYFSANFIRGAMLDLDVCSGVEVAVESVKPLSIFRKALYALFGQPKKGIPYRPFPKELP